MNASSQSEKSARACSPQALSRGTPRDAWLAQELLIGVAALCGFEKPVIRLTDFENRCFSGIEQARWKSKKPMFFLYSV